MVHLQDAVNAMPKLYVYDTVGRLNLHVRSPFKKTAVICTKTDPTLSQKWSKGRRL